ncbi:hypothetical protein CPter291_0475 [Collimonas pratensis]|uniref:Uncharacterized protein n=1 Tax=Collimonas pratensis TaxID=279113 RepID=A0ABM5Z159_9BURK|nr:hypothetical protein CPter291_0475 [Collimonas pratensis]
MAGTEVLVFVSVHFALKNPDVHQLIHREISRQSAWIRQINSH